MCPHTPTPQLPAFVMALPTGRVVCAHAGMCTCQHSTAFIRSRALLSHTHRVLYLFGGSTQRFGATNQVFNDLWALDLNDALAGALATPTRATASTWAQLVPNGTAVSKRGKCRALSCSAALGVHLVHRHRCPLGASSVALLLVAYRSHRLLTLASFPPMFAPPQGMPRARAG